MTLEVEPLKKKTGDQSEQPLEQTPVNPVVAEASQQLDALMPEVKARAQLEDVKQDIDFNFTDAEKDEFKKAFPDKELKEPITLTEITPEEINEAELRHSGIRKILFLKKEKNKNDRFASHNNHRIEWELGLKHFVDENVSEITLSIHPKNLDKGGNKQLLEKYPQAKEAYDAYKKDGTVTYFERKSTSREDGNFSNEDGYFRIFDGDNWKVEKVLTEADVQAKNEAQKEEKVEEKNSNTTTEPKAQRPQRGPNEPIVPVPVHIEKKVRANAVSEKPRSLDAARESFGDDLVDECKKQGASLELVKLMMALSERESRWNMHAENRDTHAYGNGQFLASSALGVQRQLLATGRTDIPRDKKEFLAEMKNSTKLQAALLVRLTKDNSRTYHSRAPGMSEKLHRTFLAIAHHDGLGGSNGYYRWWVANGRPDEIPPFPDKEKAAEYLHASFQRNRSLGGREGTNGLINWVDEIAQAATRYEPKVAQFIRKSETATA